MKKYKLLKDLPNGKAGLYEIHSQFDDITTLVTNTGTVYYVNIQTSWLCNKEWFEEVKEPKSIYELENFETYYTIAESGDIEERNYSRVTKALSMDLDFRFSVGNIFLTKEEAEKELAKRKAMVKIKKWSWENDNGYKMKWGEMSYYIYLDGMTDKEDAEFTIQETFVGETPGEIYYSSEEKAEQALEELEPEYKIILDVK